MDMFSEGDRVRRVEDREAVDIDFEGPARQHGKKVGIVKRVYQEQGDAVCDLEYSDGTTETGVAFDDLEPAGSNLV